MLKMNKNIINTKKIKVFVDAHAFDKEFQGTQTFIRGLYTALLENHSRDLDIYFGVHNLSKFSMAFPGVPFSQILQYKKYRSGPFRLLTDIPSYLKKYQFDFAHFQNIFLQKNNYCKIIITLHDIIYNDFPGEFPFIYRNMRNLLFRKSIQRATIKTSVSSYSRDRISHRYKIAPEQIHIIPNGANDIRNGSLTKREASLFIKEKFGVEDFILYVSRVEPRKNHLLLLEKYLHLQLYKQNIPLIFIGKSSIRVPALEKRVSGLTGEQRNMFHRYEQVSQDDLIKLYKSCRLFVYPSKGEGFGIPPLEAAVCGAPVLCSNVSAMKEYHFFEPFTFNPDNEMEFERKLTNMINCPPHESFMRKVASKISDCYSWQQSAETFYNLLTLHRK
jgi:glycosyltransferase involved in cell wall biosynthesis